MPWTLADARPLFSTLDEPRPGHGPGRGRRPALFSPFQLTTAGPTFRRD